MNYLESLEWLESLHPQGNFKKDSLRLDRIEQLLKLLGDPHEQFKSIHVAGTSGKGSTAYFTALILQEAGYKTGLFVSPHVQTVNEYISINRKFISNEEFAELATELNTIYEENTWNFGAPTRFETLTAMAFTYFSRQQVEFAVAEVGMGGEVDATNVLKPLVSIITNVSLDHQNSLGQTTLEIAKSKSGIIKHQTPVIVGSVEGEALEVMEKKAAAVDAPVVKVEKNKLIEMNIDSIKFRAEFGKKSIELETRSSGEFQLENSALAIKACELLSTRGYEIDEAAIVNGFRNVSIPCRFELVQAKPAIILDGAHNAAKAEALVKTFNILKAKPDLLIGILKTKDAESMIQHFAQIANSFTFIQPQLGKTYHSTEELRKITDALGIDSEVIGGSEEELFNFLKNYRGKILCITGSLYLCGMARNYWFPPDEE